MGMGTPVLPRGLCTKNIGVISLFSETPEGTNFFIG